MTAITLQSMKRCLLILTASLGLAAAAPASMVTLNMSGSFGPTSTLGGTAFGVATPFTFHATFHSTTDTYAKHGLGIFPTTSFSIVLPSGTYTAGAGAGLKAFLLDPTLLAYSAGLVSADRNYGFYSSFWIARPAFSADAPTPAVLSGYIGNNYSLPFTIALDGGAGNLVVNALGSGPFTAEITAVVPEPDCWAMMGLTLVGVAGYGYCRFRLNRAV